MLRPPGDNLAHLQAAHRLQHRDPSVRDPDVGRAGYRPGPGLLRGEGDSHHGQQDQQGHTLPGLHCRHDLLNCCCSLQYCR